ncbi:MAG: LysM peptidoglycan-binding domain-containing protein [Anaerolineaceae bacterium]|nr:LysM peptidoglycan-binding domain-containing protein [Anaerolineaceae bacterium]
MKELTVRHPQRIYHLIFTCLCLAVFLLTGCLPTDLASGEAPAPFTAQPTPTAGPTPTIEPTRPVYSPGELVDYIAQTGDTLPVLAEHFNTTVREIRQANTFIPLDATTMPPGMPMKIPIYYQPLWGSAYQIIHDSLYINGPAQRGFDSTTFVNQQPGWLKNFSEYASGQDRTGAQIVDLIALNHSVSPRLLLALLEYELGALTDPAMPAGLDGFPLGEVDLSTNGLYRQLNWAANALNNGYYGWRSGGLTALNLPGDLLERPDPWQNAATVALQHYFTLHHAEEEYRRAIGPEGFAATYAALFGDPWAVEAHIPGSLRQPDLRLPFLPGLPWAYTGGPHSAWGTGEPFAAIDFAPPSEESGCVLTEEYTTAVADGIVARTGPGILVLDLDGDSDEHTGWTIFYLHIAGEDRAPKGRKVQAGDLLGHPSCEGGLATGTHIHIARKYNGEWVLADSTLAFNMEGWVVRNGPVAYQGFLVRNGRQIIANTSSEQSSQIQAEAR